MDRKCLIDIYDLPLLPGFMVYNAETGEPLEEIIVPISLDMNPLGIKIAIKNPKFGIDMDGDLFAFEHEDKMTEHYYVPRENKYIIQVGTGGMYRW